MKEEVRNMIVKLKRDRIFNVSKLIPYINDFVEVVSNKDENIELRKGAAEVLFFLAGKSDAYLKVGDYANSFITILMEEDNSVIRSYMANILHALSSISDVSNKLVQYTLPLFDIVVNDEEDNRLRRNVAMLLRILTLKNNNAMKMMYSRISEVIDLHKSTDDEEIWKMTDMVLKHYTKKDKRKKVRRRV